MADWADCLEAAYHAFVIVGGVAAFILAVRRIRIAEKNLRQEHFKIAGELLAPRDHGYASRVAGAVMMAEIARKDPRNYEKPVMRAFEAFLEHPPRYADIRVHQVGVALGDQKKMIDYESRDTVTIIEAIRERTHKQRCVYPNFTLSAEAPFVLWEDDKHIICNPTNLSYGPWKQRHGGRSPSYESLAELRSAIPTETLPD